jgi:hypothetical protein
LIENSHPPNYLNNLKKQPELMKNIRENTIKKPLNILAKTQGFCKFTVTTNNTVNDDFHCYLFIPYIYAARDYSNHWLQCLSLLTEGSSWLFFAPTPKFSLTSNSNDK